MANKNKNNWIEILVKTSAVVKHVVKLTDWAEYLEIWLHHLLFLWNLVVELLKSRENPNLKTHKYEGESVFMFNTDFCYFLIILNTKLPMHEFWELCPQILHKHNLFKSFLVFFFHLHLVFLSLYVKRNIFSALCV